MPICQICLNKYKKIYFQTDDVSICLECTKELNESPEPVHASEARLSASLARGMQRNIEKNLLSDQEWKRKKAQWEKDNFEEALAKALPGWIKKLCKDPKNGAYDVKVMRALKHHLRHESHHLKRLSGPTWLKLAHGIRIRDEMQCQVCGKKDATLDAHHIVYLSNYGTNRKSNLVTLCRTCHEKEHGRSFDLPVKKNPEAGSQTDQIIEHSLLEKCTTLPVDGLQQPGTDRKVDMRCPQCSTELTATICDPTEQKIRCPKCHRIFSFPAGNDKQNLTEEPNRESKLTCITKARIAQDISITYGPKYEKLKNQELGSARSTAEVLSLEATSTSSYRYGGLVGQQEPKPNQTLKDAYYPGMMTDGFTTTGDYIEAGVRDFSTYAKAMLEEFGDPVRPYLLVFYEGVRNYPGLDTRGMSSSKDAAGCHADMMHTMAASSQGRDPRIMRRIGPFAPLPAKSPRSPHKGTIEGWRVLIFIIVCAVFLALVRLL